MAALCPTQKTEIKPALGLLLLFKLLSPRLQLWSLVDPIAWVSHLNEQPRDLVTDMPKGWFSK